MAWKPSQQNPVQDGGDDPPTINPPMRMNLRVEATPGFHEIMRQGDVSPAQVGSAITDYYATNISHFVDKNRLQKSIGGQPQQRRSWSAPGIRVDYQNNQGQEDLNYTVFPERAPVPALHPFSRVEILLDGYAYLTITTKKPDPIPIPGYWVEILGVKYLVDYVDPDTSGDSGIPWLPFDFDRGEYEPDAWAVGATFPHVVTFTDVTTVNQFDPFEWRLDDLTVVPGGYGLPGAPIADFTEPIDITLNGKKIAHVDLPFTSVSTLNTIWLEFGKDALRQHSIVDEIRTDKLLNKIVPPRRDELLPSYFPFWIVPGNPPRNDFKFLFSKTGEVAGRPKDFVNDFGRNLFEINSSRNFKIQIEFYDRRTPWRMVFQSPHFTATPGNLILVNDKPLVWTETHFSNVLPVVVNFKDPDEHFTGGGG